MPSYFPILNILVPHTGHFPCVAGLPFAIVIWTGSAISLLVRHFTQYASIASLLSTVSASCNGCACRPCPCGSSTFFALPSGCPPFSVIKKAVRLERPDQPRTASCYLFYRIPHPKCRLLPDHLCGTCVLICGLHHQMRLG